MLKHKKVYFLDIDLYWAISWISQYESTFRLGRHRPKRRQLRGRAPRHRPGPGIQSFKPEPLSRDLKRRTSKVNQGVRIAIRPKTMFQAVILSSPQGERRTLCLVFPRQHHQAGKQKITLEKRGAGSSCTSFRSSTRRFFEGHGWVGQGFNPDSRSGKHQQAFKYPAALAAEGNRSLKIRVRKKSGAEASASQEQDLEFVRVSGLPSHALAERGDVGGVVRSMPGVERECAVQSLHA